MSEPIKATITVIDNKIQVTTSIVEEKIVEDLDAEIAYLSDQVRQWREQVERAQKQLDAAQESLDARIAQRDEALAAGAKRAVDLAPAVEEPPIVDPVKDPPIIDMPVEGLP